jgi:hypothetical protein
MKFKYLFDSVKSIFPGDPNHPTLPSFRVKKEYFSGRRQDRARETDDKMYGMHKSGMTPHEIAKETGYSVSGVRNKLISLGISKWNS